MTIKVNRKTLVVVIIVVIVAKVISLGYDACKTSVDVINNHYDQLDEIYDNL